ncbi:MAG TPA: hypothetical protein VHU40_05640 [Polyangia bacterium]|nr:hypothetical protein [Polyangia bacterium]
MKKRTSILAGIGIAAATLATGCTQQPIFLPSHDFERPTDMAFSCLRVIPGETDARVVGLPMDACHPPGAPDPLIGPNSPYKTFAFVTNSERGDVSVLDMSYCRPDDTNCQQKALQPGAHVVDLDPSTIGYAAAPVGELPETIVSSQDGCRLLTANHGSCDLTAIDPAALLTPHLTQTPLGPYSHTFMVHTGSHVPLALAAGEVQFVPQQTAGLSRDDGNICQPHGTLAAPVGEVPATLENPASWRAIVTFPSCDLVALIDIETETILDSYQARPDGDGNFVFTAMGTEPVCPRIDCGPGAGTVVDAGVTTDDAAAGGAPGVGGFGGVGGMGGAAGGAGDAAGGAGGASHAPTPPAEVGSLGLKPIAIRPEGTRVYIGATNVSSVGALDIVGARLAEPAKGSSTRLPGARGVMRLRLSVDPFAYASGHPNDPTKPEFGRFVSLQEQDPSNPLQYLYVIARDTTLRIMDVSGPEGPIQCDVGVDPTRLDADQEKQRKCFPLGQQGLPHLPQVLGYDGLRFPSPPQDVAFATYYSQVSADPTVQAVSEQTLNGAFAFVLTGAGSVFVINIDPETRKTAQVLANPDDPSKPTADVQPESPVPLPNTPRDANVITYSQNLLPSAGPARVDSALPVTTSNGPILRLFDAVTTRENAVIVPYVQNGVWAAPTNMTVPSYVYFPNLVTVLPQTWTVAWEPDLTGNRVNGDIDPARTPKDDPLGLTMAITDQGAAFCTSGIFPGDTLTLTGCTSDDNCGPGRVCVRSPDAPSTSNGYPITGLCFRASDAANKDLVMNRCLPLLGSFRRYEILPTTEAIDKSQPESTVVVAPKKTELPITGTCNEATNCPPPSRTDLKGFTCDKPSNRCLMKCDPTVDKTTCNARPGSTCVNFGDNGGGWLCADGAPLRDPGGPIDDLAQACGLGQLISYSVSAGKSFVVAGSAVGRIDPGTIVDASPDGKQKMWQCASATPLHDSPLVSRIPLDIPHCQIPSLTKFMDGPNDTRGNPTALPTEADFKAAFMQSAVPSPNPCFIEFGEETARTGSGDPTRANSAPTYSALFQNREIRIVLTNLEKTSGDTVRIQFGVNGGAVAQQVGPAIDSAIGLPARILLGPVPSTDQTLALMGPNTMADPLAGPLYDMPFLYVIDQRPSAVGRSPSRGQILRISPRTTDSTPLPGYQSGTASNSYFPIQ